ncbi:DEAD/DEAH box helicase [Desulfovibrio aminophilus]|nr:DEAD/DEAH box helicase [Desulfovibrio aminophilus]MCM0754399.1 DEAD/DEAH box helicase [Desulfovibrio aminophilus]
MAPCFDANIRALGYVAPTPIQEQAIPPVMQGRDVMGLAQTGTGKTAAFMLPILNRLLQGERKGRAPRALVVAPTRELAEQIADSARDLGRNTGLRFASIYGGVGYAPQTQKLRNGVDLLVACPGRLLDHLDQRNVDLSSVEVLVLDEADHMFDMGFLPPIRKILTHLPKERQTLLFSATMPEDIRGLAQEILSDPVTVRVGRIAPAATVSHAVYPVAQHLKTPLLLEMLKRLDTGSVLVFTRTKHRARRVGEQLLKAGHAAASIQGNLSQNKRQAALDGFRVGKHRILVATDIAARGIDVSLVEHVINYDIPDTAEAYTHRIGRTGRAERTGEAHTFVTRDDATMIRAIERVLGKPLPRRNVDGFDYDVPAPARDTEFARPPMPPRGQRKPRAAAEARSEGKGERRERPAERRESARPERREGASRPERREQIARPERREARRGDESRARRPEDRRENARPSAQERRPREASRPERREGGRRNGSRFGQGGEQRRESPRIGYFNRKRPYSPNLESNGNVAPRRPEDEPNGNVLDPRQDSRRHDRYDDAPRVAPLYLNR